MATYIPILGTSVAGWWDDVHLVWRPLGWLYLPTHFDSSTGQHSAINSTPAALYFYSGSLASNGVVAYFVNSTIPYADHRPTTFSNSGVTFSVGNGTQAYDTDPNSYTQFYATSNYDVDASVDYYGIASATVTGWLVIKYRLIGAEVDNGAGSIAEAIAKIDYTMDGTNWSNAVLCPAGADTGIGTWYGTWATYSMANVRVRVTVQTRRVTLPTAIAKAQALIYDITVNGS